MFENCNAENTLPFGLKNYINNEELKINYENFDNIYWILAWKNIYIKDKMHIYKQRFTIAHEVWHYFHWSTFSIDFANFRNNPYEKEADEYAINQLVDTEDLIDKVKSEWSLEYLENHFWVPKEEILKKIRKIFKSEELNFYF